MFATSGLAYLLYKSFQGAGPIVDAVRYGGGQSQQGIHLSSTREPAYSVHIEPAKIGEYTLHFDKVLYRLDGDGFLPALVSRERTHSDLESVWINLKKQGADPPACIPLVIVYKDAEGHQYKTKCQLCRDVNSDGPGFDLRFIRRGMTGPLEQLRDYFKNRKR